MIIIRKDKNEIHPLGSFDKIQLSDKLCNPISNEANWFIRGYKYDGKPICFGKYDSEEEAKISFNKLLSAIESGERIYTI